MDYTIAPNTTAIGAGDGPPATGTPGEFTAGNPATGTPATVLPGYQMNAIVEEIVAVIKAAGLTPDRTNTAQMLAASQKLFAALNGSTSQTFNVANATSSSEAVNLGQAQADFAALNGSTSQTFNVANATSSSEAVNLGQAQADFAALNGSSSQTFNATTISVHNTGSQAQIYTDPSTTDAYDLVVQTGPSTAYKYNIFQPDGRLTLGSYGKGSNDAVALGQAQADFAALNGSSSQPFNVVDATTSTEAVNLGQLISFGGNSASVSNVTSASTSVSFTPAQNCIVLVNATGGGGSVNISDFSISQGGGTLQHSAHNWTSTSTLGVASAIITIAAGSATTITATVSVSSASTLTPNLTYILVPTP